MSERKEFELSEADLAKLLDASKPTPVMFLSGGQSMFATPQENANRTWKEVGDRMGFDHMTVRTVPGKGQRFITAEATR